MKYQFRRAVLILLFFVLLAGIHLFIYTQNIDLKYKTTRLKIKLQELVSQNRALGSQVAQKENLKTVEEVAMKKLNMVYPEKVNYIVPDSATSSAEGNL